MSVYSTVPLARPKRAAHNLSHSVDTTANIGQIIPTARPIECVPGDTIDLSSVTSVDLMPLVRPFKGDLWFESWAFFVTNDMLYKNSDSGTFTQILVSASNPKEALSLPSASLENTSDDVKVGTLYDYYGCPIGVGTNISGIKLTRYPFRGYYKTIEDYFEDENLGEKPFTDNPNGSDPKYKIYNINYKKDRFTSAFLSPQKGNPIAVPITTTSTISVDSKFVHTLNGVYQSDALLSIASPNPHANIGARKLESPHELYDSGEIQIENTVNAGTINATLTIEDLRLSNKLQKWLERLQLCGSRNKEYLLANYGIAPNDETLQRPVLIGHIKTPVIVDSVIQNIPTNNSVAANKTGNGVTVQSVHFGKWLCKEFGWVIILSALRPKASYTQGFHRSLIKNTIYDFFNPIFENLGQQEILNCEVFAQNNSDDKGVWGYTDRYNEYRHIESMTTGALRATNSGMQNWVMARRFAELPDLSADFIRVNASEYDYLFNFTHSVTLPQAVIHSVNMIKAIRPISKYAHPSL